MSHQEENIKENKTTNRAPKGNSNAKSTTNNYKKTKLGWIPEEWEIEKFGEIANTYAGGVSFPKNWTG